MSKMDRARPRSGPAHLALALAVIVAGDARADVPDDARIERRVEAESASLRQVHEAEVNAGLRGECQQGPGVSVPRLGLGLGLESPLRHRLEAAMRRHHDDAQAAVLLTKLPEIDHDLRRLRAEYDIPIDVNDSVVKYVRFFQSPKVRPHFVRWLSRAPRYVPRFREILREEGIPEDTVYLAMIESGFANLATSRAKAVGPWQFIRATGKRYGLRQDFWVDERRDPEKAARSAARFLKRLHRETGDWRLAWAGYNAGPNRIARAQRNGYVSFWDMAAVKSVIPPETRAYVPKLMAAAIIAKHPAAFGFEPHEIEAETWTEYEEVVLPRATELSFVAKAAGVPVDALLELNPELRRTCTPPRRYALKIPRHKAAVFAANWPRLSSEAARTAVAKHRVVSGETLSGISRAYGVPAAALVAFNELPRRSRLPPGATVAIPLGSVPRDRADAAAKRARAALRRVKVQPGDSLWALARRHDVTVTELARWNGIRDPRRHKLHAGRVLVLRTQDRLGEKVTRTAAAKRKARLAAAPPPTVRVRPGDSLWSLASRFGISMRDLARWNGIDRPERHNLHSGRVLVLRPRVR
jgi:membrane-bound lytic murein transglycosylase D